MNGKFGGGFRPRRTFAPVKVGDEIDVKIEAVGEKGDGIAKKDGFVLFVPGVKEGDEVRIRITKVLNKVGFAEVAGEPQGEIPQSSEPSREAAAPEPDEKPEDTEDFGEEPAEEETKEQPEEAEEEAPAEGEAPAEEVAEETEEEAPAEEKTKEQPEEAEEEAPAEEEKKE